MGWYQTKSEEAQWKSLLTIQNFALSKLFDSDIFMQQVKVSNPAITNFIEQNYKLFFDQLLSYSLVVPSQEDCYDRKFKLPTHSINFLRMFLQTMGNAPQNINMPTSSITESINCLPSACPAKICSSEAIQYLIQKMFELFCSNRPQQLENTLIPGYFQKIFDLVNKSYCQALIDYVKRNKVVENLIGNFFYFDQVMKCIQSILIVPFSVTSQTININASVSMSMSMAANPSQPNYPYQIKYKSMMHMIKNIRTFVNTSYPALNDDIIIQNTLQLFLEAIKSTHNIFQGSGISQTISSHQNIQLYFKLASITCQKNKSSELQIKALQLLKYALAFSINLDKKLLLSEFQGIINYIMNLEKPSLKTLGVIQLLNQWIKVEYGLINNPAKMQKSCSSSISQNLSSMQTIDLAEIISKSPIYKKLIRKCTEYSSFNIFHLKVCDLIITTFKTRNQMIINSIFRDNDIIRQTVTKTKDFKKNEYFGFFFIIIQTYTSQRIDSNCVNQIIKENQKIWRDFYIEVLEPHTKKINGKCGEMDHPQSVEQLKYSVDRTALSKKQNPPEQIQNFTLDENQKKKLQKDDDEVTPLIKINLPQSNTSQQEESEGDKSEQQSFQNFLKKKMQESEQQIKKQKKKALSKTPTKMRSVSSKKKKWSVDTDHNQSLESKKVNLNQKFITEKKQSPKKSLSMKNAPKIKLLRIQTSKMPRKPRQRKIQKTDASLMKWLAQLNQCNRLNLQAVR